MDKKLTELQNKIKQTKKELEEIRKLEKPLPEFINTTNVLRSNEYYSKEIEKQSELIHYCENYFKELEKLVLTAINLRSKINELKIRSKKSKTKRKLTKKNVIPKSKQVRRSSRVKRNAKKSKQRTSKKYR